MSPPRAPGWLVFIADSNLFIALAAALFVGSTFWMYGLSPNYYLSGFVFAATLFTYNFQRQIGMADRDKSVQKSKVVMMLIGATGALVLVLFLDWLSIALLGFSGLLSIAYALPFFRFREKKIALRQLPFAKVWIILIVWILSGIIVPRLQWSGPAGFDEGLSLLFLLFQQGAFIFGLTLFFDVRDLAVDEPSQKTIPMIFGIDGTIKIARIAFSLSFLAVFGNYFLGYFSPDVILVHLANIFLCRLLLRKLTTDKPELFFTLLVDGMMVVQGVGMGLVWLI